MTLSGQGTSAPFTSTASAGRRCPHSLSPKRQQAAPAAQARALRQNSGSRRAPTSDSNSSLRPSRRRRRCFLEASEPLSQSSSGGAPTTRVPLSLPAPTYQRNLPLVSLRAALRCPATQGGQLGAGALPGPRAPGARLGGGVRCLPAHASLRQGAGDGLLGRHCARVAAGRPRSGAAARRAPGVGVVPGVRRGEGCVRRARLSHYLIRCTEVQAQAVRCRSMYLSCILPSTGGTDGLLVVWAFGERTTPVATCQHGGAVTQARLTPFVPARPNPLTSGELSLALGCRFLISGPRCRCGFFRTDGAQCPPARTTSSASGVCGTARSSPRCKATRRWLGTYESGRTRLL